MMRYLADENFSNNLLRGLRARLPNLDIVRAQDVEIYQASDPVLLGWAAQQSRIVLTHDVNTIPGYAYERVAQGLPMPGVIEVDNQAPMGAVLDDLYFLIAAGEPGDFENQVIYVPL